MEYLTLNNNIQMPLVGFGTFMLSSKACTNAVASAIQAGYRMIDTAEAYGNEKEVGEGIKKSGIDRKELFLVTKVNFKSYEHTAQTVMQSGLLRTTMQRGAAWKNCMQMAKSELSEFPTLNRISCLT